MMVQFQLILLILMLSVFAGCAEKKQGPLERAGNRVDEIVDNVKDGDPVLHKKGPLEEAGETIDDAVGSNKRRR